MVQAAIYMNPEAFNTSGEHLMGRHSAGESFLRGYLRHGTAERHVFWNVAHRSPDLLERFLESFDLGGKPVTWISRAERGELSKVDALFLPAPHVEREAWARRPYGGPHYSITGITHTTATHRVMDMIGDSLLSPIEPWDALICTSRALRASVETQLEAVSEYLASQLGATRVPSLRLETIPLGLETGTFERDPAQRQAWRERLDIPADAPVVLYVGRFNITSKMNPVPMAIALERAAQETGKPIYWVLSGWALDEKQAEEFHASTRAHCPSVHYRVVDGRKPEARFSVWSVADIFLSLSDNIQETFGLTPVEAMAAGLPSVISDWDGYKDTVRHNQDGFRVQTFGPRPGLGNDLAYRHANSWEPYEGYVGSASQFTAVDLDETVTALRRLIENPDLRQRMGDSAKRRAAGLFDWRHIIPQYEELWADLGRRRRAAKQPPPAREAQANPWRLDPFRLFASYPTEALTPQTVVRLAPGVTAESAAEMFSRPLVGMGPLYLPLNEERDRMVSILCSRPQLLAREVVEAFPGPRAGFVERGLLWLAKYGIVQILGRSTGIAS